MIRQNDINLLVSQTIKSSKYIIFETELRVIATVCLVVTAFMSLVIFGLFFYSSTLLKTAVNQKEKLLVSISKNASKELTYRMIQAYIPYASEIIKKRVSYDQIIEKILYIDGPPRLSQIIIGNDMKISLTYTLNSIQEAISIVDNVRSLLIEDKVKNVFFGPFSIDEKGGLHLSMSYITL